MKIIKKFFMQCGVLLWLIAIQSVYADVSVKYSEINSIKDLEAVIKNPAAPVFKQELNNPDVDVSDTVSVSVPQEGWLFLAGFAKGTSGNFSYIDIALYSDKNLISQIHTGITGGTEQPLIKYVKARTYYFNLKKWPKYKDYSCTVFPAFRPRVQQIVPVQHNIVSSLEGLDDLISSGISPTSYELLEYYQKGYSGNIHKIVLPSKGTLFVKNLAVRGSDRDSYDVMFSLYSDVNLVKLVDERSSSNSYPLTLSLAAGTYYYTNRLDYGSTTEEIRNYLGFAPDIKLSAPKLIQFKRYSKKIVGRAAAGSTVHVTVQGKKYSAKVGAKGRFTVKLKLKLKPGKKIKAYVTMGTKRSKTTTAKVR